MTKEDTLEELGGEPLEGSGFENETPEFSESDTQGEIQLEGLPADITVRYASGQVD
jgi:hypothetical protein